MTNRYKRLSDWCYFFGVTPLLAALPRSLGYRLARRQARLVRRANRPVSIQTDRNISLVLDDDHWSALAKAEAAGRTFEAVVAEDLDTLYFPFLSDSNISRYFEFQGLERIDSTRRLRKGALLFTGNFGSVSSALVALSVRGYTLNHIGRDPRVESAPSHAFRAFLRLRTSLMRRKMDRDLLFVPVQASYSQLSSNRAIVEAYRLLAMNETVSLVIDAPPQLAHQTARVEFLGRDCFFPTAVVELAHRSKAPVVPFFILRDRDSLWKQKVVVGEQVPMTGKVEVDLQRCVDRLADVVLEHPEQWRGWASLDLFWAPATGANASAA